MTQLHTHHVVAGRFEAARQLSAATHPKAHARLHGHGFGLVAIGETSGSFDALDRDVQAACQALNYQDLNAALGHHADNRAILEWFCEALKDQPIRVLQLETEIGTVATFDVRDKIERVAQTFEFEAAHQLPHVPKGHKCGRMHGHGFSVSIQTQTDPEKSMECAQALIDEAWSPLAATLQWSCLNDIPGLENPTSEHLALWLWNQLQTLPGLISVSVNETPTAGCCFDGNKMRIWKEQTFDSAVQLTEASNNDPRRAIHGHTFKTRLHLTGPLDQVLGWVYDYGDVKEVFGPLFDSLDHRPLYEIEGLAHADDLTLAQYIYTHMKPKLAMLSGVDIEHRHNRGAWVFEKGQRHDL